MIVRRAVAAVKAKAEQKEKEKEKRLLGDSDDATAGTAASSSAPSPSSSSSSSSSPLDSLTITNLRAGHAERKDAVLTIKLLFSSTNKPAAGGANGISAANASSSTTTVLWSGLQNLVQDESEAATIEAAVVAGLQAAL